MLEQESKAPLDDLEADEYEADENGLLGDAGSIQGPSRGDGGGGSVIRNGR